jgi:hypothetical protein
MPASPDMTAMDEAAKVAAKDFAKLLTTKATVEDVADWWAKHYRSAGHKRLARLLLNSRRTP